MAKVNSRTQNLESDKPPNNTTLSPSFFIISRDEVEGKTGRDSAAVMSFARWGCKAAVAIQT
jgi:hypothetical protein